MKKLVMKKVVGRCVIAASLLVALIPKVSQAQDDKKDDKKKQRKHEFYFSWGYNEEWFTKSTISINQPSLGNNYQFVKISGKDNPGWTDNFFHKNLTIPQYNYRIGMIIDKEKGWGAEINFDHTKFVFTDGETAHMKGTYQGRQVDSTVVFSEKNGDYYYLNNGANFLLFNVTKRWHLLGKFSKNFKLDGYGKLGIGPVIPHVQNSLFGQKNDPGFQFGGWNTGVEGTLKATFFNHVFLEYCNKLDYARYSNLQVYQGHAKQAFGTYEMILNLGITFPVGKREK
jgi:hypothetical protein